MIRVAAVQFEPRLGMLKENRDQSSKLIKEALDKGAQLIVLPELINSGYNFQSQIEAEHSAETYPLSETIAAWKEVMKDADAYLFAGYNEREKDQLFNSMVILGPNDYVNRYRKIHLFGREKLFFQPNSLPLELITVFDYKVGPIICFDWIFPELIRAYALLGADIICQSANLVLPYCQSVMVGRSIENHIFTITANRIGIENSLVYTGKSQITDVTGAILAKASEDESQIIIADIDPSKARHKQLNKYNHLFKDRRPIYYQQLQIK